VYEHKLPIRGDVMTDPESEIVVENEILQRAVWKKWNKYTWSGLIIVGIGCVLIAVGLPVWTEFYSNGGILLVGFGAIAVVVGLIRVFIGLINPTLPSDLRRRRRRNIDGDDQEILRTTLGPGSEAE
jgi:hypothetical protein